MLNSKPGAAAVSTWLSNKTIGLNQQVRIQNDLQDLILSFF